MAKRLLEDIVRVKSKMKQPVKREPERIISEPVVAEPPRSESRPTPQFPKEPFLKSSRSRPHYMLWFIALVSVAFCFFAVSLLFSKAEVVAVPKIEDVVLNENFSAVKNLSENGLVFNLVIIDGVENITIPTPGEKDVALKAIGIVKIFNDFSSASQTLDIDTRLEGSNGKMYKTKAKTSVPGRGKDGTPGSIEMEIYAAEAGAEYNSGPLDFYIFGFKGTPKYAKFKVRSQGEITGGFKGKMPNVSDDEKASAVQSIKDSLRQKLLLRATSQTPSERILFKDAVFLTTDEANMSQVYNNDNTATLTLKGSLAGILFSEDALAKKVAKEKVEKYDGSEVYISNLKDLTFSLVSKDSNSFGDVKNINFNLSGQAKIVWKINLEKFSASLLGKAKKDFTEILSQSPNIDSATLTLRPFWRRSIPEESKNIKITINYPK